MKFAQRMYLQPEAVGRSREGAWIEIYTEEFTQQLPNVAPVRERGLKC